jgi:hypothetical protein
MKPANNTFDESGKARGPRQSLCFLSYTDGDVIIFARRPICISKPIWLAIGVCFLMQDALYFQHIVMQDNPFTFAEYNPLQNGFVGIADFDPVR